MKAHSALPLASLLLLAGWGLTGPQPVVAQSTPVCGPGILSTPAGPPPPTNLRIIGGGLAEALDSLFDDDPPSGPNAGDEEAPAVAPVPGPHDYFEALRLRPDCQAAYSLRDPAQINTFKFGTYPAKVTYNYAGDPHPQKQDAAKFSWNTNDVNSEQIRVPIELTRPASGSRKLLIISDHYWDQSWFTEFIETVNPFRRLDGWKWLQVTDNYADPTRTTKQSIWFEPQMRWIGWDTGILSWFGARGYTAVRAPTVKGGAGVVICGKNFLGDSIGPMLNCFKARALTWTRTFIEIEQRAGDDHARISYWMADETQEATPILLGAQMFSGGANRQFWIEYNTSRDVRAGGPMAAYARNIVVLKDVAVPTSVFQKPVR